MSFFAEDNFLYHRKMKKSRLSTLVDLKKNQGDLSIKPKYE